LAINAAAHRAVRLAHISDIHVTAPECVWRREDWFNKRLSAWINLRLLGRGYRFRRADHVLSVLAEEIRRGGFDRIVFSGDASAMGFEEEVTRAAYLLKVGQAGEMSGIAVPGNHDYCTATAARAGHFERVFAPWQSGERIDHAVYPFAQRVGHAWLIGVNSSTANRWPWDARGGVGRDQLRRLEELLQQLNAGPRILVTHYPVWLASGRREPRIRALRDLDALVRAAERGGVGLWLHGHRHNAYYHPPSDFAPFPVVCAGSATQNGRWSYKAYTLEGYHLRAQSRVYRAKDDRFHDAEAFELDVSRAGAEVHLSEPEA
jgi:3',5'-cyclic AMP phosphodiesterase CpdA